MKSIHHSAKHHVYAYILENMEEKFSDDGEPSGTGGMPLLNAIKKFNLKEIMVVVVRYFGGILLGTGPLRRMYAETAEKVLEISGSSKLSLCSEILVKCNYKQIGQIKNIISNFGGKILDIKYFDEVNIYFCIKNESDNLVVHKIEDIIRGKEKIKIVSENYHSMDF